MANPFSFFGSSAAGRKRRSEEVDQAGDFGLECAADAGGEITSNRPNALGASTGEVVGAEGSARSGLTRSGPTGGEMNEFQDPLGELRNFNARKMFAKLNLPDDKFEEWLKKMGLLHSKRTCECGARMKLRNPQQGAKYGKWRCVKKKCSKEKGYLVGTQFEGSALSLKDIFQLSYYFARQTHIQEKIQFDMQRTDGETISRVAISDWNNIFREACGWHFCNDPVLIGGPGKIVEIDETVVTKRKYHRGALRAEEYWVFGGVQRDDHTKCFLIPVKRRDAETLLPILARHIAEGTTIISDGWAAYGGIQKIKELQTGCQAYSHFTVIHSENRLLVLTPRRLKGHGRTSKPGIRRREEQQGISSHRTSISSCGGRSSKVLTLSTIYGRKSVNFIRARWVSWTTVMTI